MNTLLIVLTLMAGAPAADLVKVTEHTAKLADGKAAAPTTVEEMAWLTGRWVGDGLGGSTEETWGAPEGGVMIGTFRLVRNSRPVFYEFMTLSQTENGLALRLKHFNPDMKGWEEKEKFVEFRYIGSDGPLVHFSSLTFDRSEPNSLTIYLALRQKNGELREEKFRMTRQK